MQNSTHSPLIKFAPVAEDEEHVRAAVKRRGKVRLLARFAPEDSSCLERGGFLLEWLVGDRTAADRELRQRVQASINFLYTCEQGPRYWHYVIHHTTTASNLYSCVGGGVFWQWMKTDAAAH